MRDDVDVSEEELVPDVEGNDSLSSLVLVVGDLVDDCRSGADISSFLSGFDVVRSVDVSTAYDVDSISLDGRIASLVEARFA